MKTQDQGVRGGTKSQGAIAHDRALRTGDSECESDLPVLPSSPHPFSHHKEFPMVRIPTRQTTAPRKVRNRCAENPSAIATPK